ncbi:metalloregulator ArsR/SmtB family transcription factor [Actinomadura sp. NEAU-AAG7]|uniref:ArsR/SmtB family transcription factor n=1 Tax=Actinomadura sp. NEAU-AAG7 TaxID=2839640 RepID=UPI001BE4A509|nr:metalloregulator ArsR/SmtB family transcription factor [Actinomadura sp. NEAU-AAG7]MBT2209029.1 metalloregulator ArsR/SmtB family transcription factor [Actinomadura sp. NEAU-AAG7]
MGGFAEEPIYEQLARIGKALASPVRLRLLDVLDQGERTVEELASAAGVPLKNTSAQLQRLRAAHLVAARRSGTRVHYRVADPAVSRFLEELRGLAHDRLADLRASVALHLGAGVEAVAADDLAARLSDPATLVVDVRSAEEYARGHVPGAVSMPFEGLRDRLGGLPPDGEIVAYCGGPYCVVSPDAVRLLREHGFEARPLDGGFARWHRSGHPVAR